MYVTALECARRGIDLAPDPGMSMLWANGPAAGWETHGYFHDAGVTAENGRDFLQDHPPSLTVGQSLDVHPESASARYVERSALHARRTPS